MEKVRENLGDMRARINAPAMTAEGMRAKALWPEEANKLIEALEVAYASLGAIESACPSEWKQDLKKIARQALARVEEILN